MRRDEQIKRMPPEYAGISNAWKNGKANLGLTRVDGVGKKRLYEAEFQRRVDANRPGNPIWHAVDRSGRCLYRTETTGQGPRLLSRDHREDRIVYPGRTAGAPRNARINGTKTDYPRAEALYKPAPVLLPGIQCRC